MTQLEELKRLARCLQDAIDEEINNDTARVYKKHFNALVKRRNALRRAIKTFEKTEGKVYG